MVASGRYTRMSPVSTMLATTRSAMVPATMPTRRRRLVNRDHDKNGAGLNLRARSRTHLRDSPGGGRQQLVLHLHRFERGERSIGVDAVALFHMHGLEEARHRRTQLDTPRPQSDRTAVRAQGALVDDGGADIVPIEVETERVVRHHGDLVTGTLERDGPLPSAYGLADIGPDDAVVDRETPVLAELDADATILERDLVTHQRSASSRPARAHAGSATATARRSPSERVARTAASAPAAAALSVSSGTLFRSRRATDS